MKNKQPLISVVSPVYRAEKIVGELVKQLHGCLLDISDNYEIVLVNDGSPDGSWDVIVRECRKDGRVKGVNLSRNFGQHYAITAGLSYAKGDWVVVMDCDLQDRPDEIVNLYRKAMEGWDVVQARRVVRNDKFVKRMSSKIFHAVYSYLIDLKSDASIGNFGIYHQKVILEYSRLQEHSRSFGVLIKFLGFQHTTIDVKHSIRYEGKSSYTCAKLVKLALDVALSNSNKPLKLTVRIGFLISFFSFLLAIYNIVAHFVGLVAVPGFTTTVFSIWFIGGLTFLVLGVLGLYIGNIYEEVKQRPLFIVRNTINVDL
jgi:dolichol-phosphate mannosyltransferase